MALNDDDIKQLISILQRGLSSSSTDSDPAPNKPTNKKTKSKPKKENRFDKMAESRMHKEDVEIDKKLIKSPPTPRRDIFKPVRVMCRICGRTEEVDPSIIEGVERYKCNKCSASAG